MIKASQTIILVGFMGTGKSTVARLLAKRLGVPQIDLDAELERREGRSIADMFADGGEASFRAAETAALAAVLTDGGPLVLATGGGAVLAAANRTVMKRHGLVVALTASAETIIERVRHDADRPLLAGDVEARVRALLEARRDAYAFADLTVDTDGLTPEEAAERILALQAAAR